MEGKLSMFLQPELAFAFWWVLIIQIRHVSSLHFLYNGSLM